MNTLKRLSLGQVAPIGTLYDARTETFLPESLLTGETPPGAIISTELDHADTARVNTSTVKARFHSLDVSPELGASLLAGVVTPRGSARYLSQQGDNVPNVERAVVYTATTVMEQLSFMTGNVREFLNLDALATTKATHVLTGITWGARAVVSAQKRISTGVDETQCERIVENALQGLWDPSGQQEHNWLDLPGDEADGQQDELQIRLYTDAREVLDGQTDNFTDALEHFSQLGPFVRKTGGKPLVYTLLPIAFLVTLGAVVSNDIMAGQLGPDCYERMLNLIDHLAYLQQKLNGHRRLLARHSGLGTSEQISQVDGHLKRARSAEARMRAAYAESLRDVRENRTTSQSMMDMIANTTNSILSRHALLDLIDKYEKKVAFLARMTHLGAHYPHDTVQNFTESCPFPAYYVFHFNDTVMDLSDPIWKANAQLLEDLLGQTQKPYILLADGRTSTELQNAYISVYENNTCVVENLLDQTKELADKHLVRYDRHSLEPTTDVPTYRKALRIPCPGPFCDEQDLRLWSCAECHETIEFGNRDGYFYCECGRVPFDRCEFNCQGPRHKSGYFQFERNDLRELLRSLPAPREVNILILGESGVGKSTFVNAFVNYLAFGSLDEGLRDPKLNCVVPCSFTTQVVDEAGRMLSKDVVVGRDKDEMDGSRGQSATQKATVYPLYFRDTLIRLIDTPGIGDTRGIDQDKQNMANMLAILRNYKDLHGILILLKPNNARLGVMFRFCVKELLTHLHTSAAQNMVFGFTNTRGSNYTPGDTFKPLESLLSEYRDVIPQLSRSNVYCFDSESFRYLAARKQGIEMGHMDDYRRSWEHSSEEADRLLAHFQGLRPHHTQETLSLNETRHLIAQLTAPMQQISVAITDTLAKNKTQMDELRNSELDQDTLQSKLRIHKTTVSAAQLAKPKTVCANEACVESVFDEASGSEVLLRKKLCHNPCCLTNVPVGKVGTPQLKSCYAFAGDNCTVCGHSWKEHEHILVEYAKKEETVIDATVQRELTSSGSMIKAKRNAIRAIEKNITELKEEHMAVQTAAAKFSLYLKNNSITHYNDATIEYLEHLIKDERTKVRTGQSRARLESLEKDLDDYKKFVDAMEQKDDGVRGSEGVAYVPLNEAGVAKLVQTLYNLPHYGQMLKDLAQVVANAYEANFRERPYRISRSKYWRGSQGSNGTLFGRKRAPHARGYSEKSKPSAEYRGNQSNDFWPSEKESSSSGPPVRSIMDWETSTRVAPMSTGPATYQPSSSFSAPPPYSAPVESSRANEQTSQNLGIVEKKGVWVRMKDKLRKM
ncbi:hypothetical protein BJX99DRAFT_272191 [Aspergillus californicus]